MTPRSWKNLKQVAAVVGLLAVPALLLGQAYDTAGRQLVNAIISGSVAITAASLPLPAGASTSANQTTVIGHVDGLEGFVDGIEALLAAAIPAGNNNIGDVDVATIAAGDNNIGNVDVVTLPSVTIGTFPDNEPFNVAQMNGVAVTMGNGASGTGVQRVTLANDSTGTVIVTQGTAANLNARSDTSGATGAAPPARADYSGGLTSGATGGFLAGFAICDSYANVTVSTATTTLLVTGVSGRHVRICSLSLVTAGANNVALISGTGATCGTGTTGMTGGTTAATGYNFSANGGITQGSGLGVVNQTNATGDSVCVITSAAVQLSGRLAYAIF